MAVKRPSTESFGADLKGVFDTLQDETVASLGQTRELQLAARSLMDLEASRLARKLGGDAARVQALKKQVAGRVELVRAIDVEAQVAAVRVPRVETDDTLLHGRITDRSLNRVAGVTVRLVDAKGEPVPGVEAASTDAQGYYAFVLKPEQTAVLTDQKLGVAIANADQTVKPAQATVTLAAGTTFVHELKLSEDELARLKLRPAGAAKPRPSAGAKPSQKIKTAAKSKKTSRGKGGGG